MKMTLEYEGDVYTIETNKGGVADELAHIFRSLMFSMGYHIETINEFVPDPND